MHQQRPRLARDMTILGGWLFADLLLALAVIFLAAQPPFPKPLVPTVTVTLSPTATATPQPIARLEQEPHRFIVHVDRAAFLSNNSGAVNSVRQQIVSQSFLQGRSAGLIVAFGTAGSDCTAERAYDVAQKVYDLVQQLGQSNPAFKNTIHYDKLCNIRSDINQITIDIFLFAQSQ
ncbi:MAG TPA: hypothetical protein VF458_07735 [Ktedonobacteraceae bacterium]